jgi:hypothetical protein
MKIALCFFGLTRSLKYTIESIKENILKPLEDAKIDFDIYLHTYYFNGHYNNSHGNEKNIKLNFDEYKLLNPKFFKIQNQDVFKKNTDFTKYYNNFKKKSDYTIQTYHNYICALNSLYQVTQLVIKNNIDYDYICYLRPDCKYTMKFNTRWLILAKKIKILIPRFAKHGGFNDRFFIGNYKQGIEIGNSILYLEHYIKNNIFNAEKFRKWIIINYCFKNTNPIIKYINFYFQRIRANGKCAILDRRYI